MKEGIESEWMERNRYNRGKPTGFRQYRTEFQAEMTIEKVILAIEEPIRILAVCRFDGLSDC